MFVNELNSHKSKNSLLVQRPDLIEENLSQVGFIGSLFARMNKTKLKYFNGLNICKWSIDLFFILALCFVVQNLFEKHQADFSCVASEKFTMNFVDDFHIGLSNLLFDLREYYFSLSWARSSPWFYAKHKT